MRRSNVKAGQLCCDRKPEMLLLFAAGAAWAAWAAWSLASATPSLTKSAGDLLGWARKHTMTSALCSSVVTSEWPSPRRSVIASVLWPHLRRDLLQKSPYLRAKSGRGAPWGVVEVGGNVG